jgi:LysR family hydrogen peroxide-inducible transcriptional activator
LRARKCWCWATSLETLRSLVAAGEGVTLIPAMAGRRGDDIVLKPLSTPAARRICLYFLKTSARRGEYRMLAETMRAALPEAVNAA